MLHLPPNFAQVVPGLWRSGSPTYLSDSARHEFARRTGLKTVVRLADEEDDLSWPSGVIATSLPGVKPVMTRAMWRRWRRLLDDRSFWPILFHCHFGAERTGVYAAHAEAHLRVKPSVSRARLQKHGETLWSRDRDMADLDHLMRSCKALRRTGDVLSDSEVARFLGADPATLDAELEAETSWRPTPPFRS